MNFFKTAMLLGALSALLLIGGEAIAGPQGLQFALIGAVAMNGLSYFFSDKIALAMSGARAVTQEQAPRLYSITQRLCERAGLPMPKLYVIPEQAPNAFATGRNPKNASVAVTAGLLELMSEDEVEGVLAHELAHVKNYDILTASVAATIAAAITFMARMAYYASLFSGGNSRDNERGGHPLAGLAMLIFAPIAAVVLQLWISRTREFAADATAAKIIGHPYGLVKALEKLGYYNKKLPMDVAPTTASLFIVAPLSGQSFATWFSTHPPLEKRIAALREMSITP